MRSRAPIPRYSAAAFAAAMNPGKAVDWPVCGGQLAKDHYSALAQINRQNVSELRRTWLFDTGEKGALQTSPLVIGHTLYAYTSSQKVIALEAASGKLLWKFDSGVKGSEPMRGLAYRSHGKQSRLFAGVMNFLYALDVYLFNRAMGQSLFPIEEKKISSQHSAGRSRVAESSNHAPVGNFECD